MKEMERKRGECNCTKKQKQTAKQPALSFVALSNKCEQAPGLSLKTLVLLLISLLLFYLSLFSSLCVFSLSSFSLVTR